MTSHKLIFGTIFANLALKLAKQPMIQPVRRGITIVPSGGVKLVQQ